MPRARAPRTWRRSLAQIPRRAFIFRQEGKERYLVTEDPVSGKVLGLSGVESSTPQYLVTEEVPVNGTVLWPSRDKSSGEERYLVAKVLGLYGDESLSQEYLFAEELPVNGKVLWLSDDELSKQYLVADEPVNSKVLWLHGDELLTPQYLVTEEVPVNVKVFGLSGDGLSTQQYLVAEEPVNVKCSGPRSSTSSRRRCPLTARCSG